MKAYLCVVSPRFPENYHIGVQARTWGVEETYRRRIQRVRQGDLLVFIASGAIRSIHEIESEVFEDRTPLWPPKGGDIFPWRIKISAPTHRGEIPSTAFSDKISFMAAVDKWGGTIQGASGVFNDRLSEADLDYIKSRLPAVGGEHRTARRAPAAPVLPEGAKSLFRFFEKDVLDGLNRLLPSIGLRRYNGRNFPGEYDLGYGGNVVLCVDSNSGDLVVVDFNRGEAPNETLLRVLHYMSWVRQNLADNEDVRGLIIAQAADAPLRQIVSEVPNVSIRLYRVGIELLQDSVA